jgi:hypothetical protein
VCLQELFKEEDNDGRKENEMISDIESRVDKIGDVAFD